MSSMTNFYENFLTDGIFRGGAANAAGTVNSTAIVKGFWTALTAYVVGDIAVPHANMTAAGGKFLRCTVAGTSGSTNTLAVPAIGSTLVDASVTWEALSGMPSLNNVYIGLYTASPSDAAGGTEVAGGSYARVAVACSLAEWAGTQAAGSTTASSGTNGTTSNNAAITFPAPTGNWGSIVSFGVFDAPTGGNLLFETTLTTPKTVNNLDPAPSFAIGVLTNQIDN